MPVVVEWAEPDISDTLLLQFDVLEIGYDLFNLRLLENLVDDAFVDWWHNVIVIEKQRARVARVSVGSLPYARPPLGGQWHRTPQAGSDKVLYPYRIKTISDKVFRMACHQVAEACMNRCLP